MKVLISQQKGTNGWAWLVKFRVETKEWTRVLSFNDVYEKDSKLGDTHSDVHGIEDVIRQAYEAGKNGEALTIMGVEGDL